MRDRASESSGCAAQASLKRRQSTLDSDLPQKAPQRRGFLVLLSAGVTSQNVAREGVRLYSFRPPEWVGLRQTHLRSTSPV
jgi:hypothetical protein